MMKATKYGLKDIEKKFGPLTFANVILSHRLAEEMTQVDMAEKLGISKQSLCDLEKGRRIPSPSRAAKIAKKLRMLPESFIELALADHLKEEKLNYEVSVKPKSKKVS